MDPRRLAVFLCFFLALILLSCGSTELSRSKAERLIAVSEAFGPDTPSLALKDTDIYQRGVREGYWTLREVFYYGFGNPKGFAADLTPKGKQIFASIANSQDEQPGLARLIQPFSRRIVDVTGIAENPSARGMKEVSFTWAWVGLPKEVTEYCETGPWKGKATLRLYDDGWRVEQLQTFERKFF